MSQVISCIVTTEEKLEKLINKLLSKAVSRESISVQGNSSQLHEKLGVEFVAPENLQHKEKTPETEPFMRDDQGWLLGFAFAIPLFISLIVSIFIIGDIQSLRDNILFGIVGLVTGSLLGGASCYFVNSYLQIKKSRQESMGGFLLIVRIIDSENLNIIRNIIKQSGAKNIAIKADN